MVRVRDMTSEQFIAWCGMSREMAQNFMMNHLASPLPARGMADWARMSTGGGFCWVENFLAPLGARWKSSAECDEAEGVCDG